MGTHQSRPTQGDINQRRVWFVVVPAGFVLTGLISVSLTYGRQHPVLYYLLPIMTVVGAAWFAVTEPKKWPRRLAIATALVVTIGCVVVAYVTGTAPHKPVIHADVVYEVTGSAQMAEVSFAGDSGLPTEVTIPWSTTVDPDAAPMIAARAVAETPIDADTVMVRCSITVNGMRYSAEYASGITPTAYCN